MSSVAPEERLPRYDYECTMCQNRFELKQSFDSQPYTDCPKCGGLANRKFHSVPIVFKGSGWYVNDYGKRGSAATSAPSSTEAESESKPKAETKAESSSSDEKPSTKKKEPASTKGKD